MNKNSDLRRFSYGLKDPMGSFWEMAIAVQNTLRAAQSYWNGVFKYNTDFWGLLLTAQTALADAERQTGLEIPIWEKTRCYTELLGFGMVAATKGAASSLESMNAHHISQFGEAVKAWVGSAIDENGGSIVRYTSKRLRLFDLILNDYPKAIQNIGNEYGFHFDKGGYIKVAETDRFELYQVLPIDEEVEVKEKGKPIIVIPPYVLGPNIVAFLPRERRSFVHRFANEGIPTYVRILKDINANPAVQVMSPEDDARDTRYFCELVKARHEKPVTLGGYCQGGFFAALTILSGEADGLVDALITCAAPMDGTRSKGFQQFLESMPECFKSLMYAQSTLPNGNRVVNGRIMSLVYKLISIDKEAPLHTFYRDLQMFDRPGEHEMKVSKMASAVNHWLLYDLRDLPVAITQMSFQSYTVPVSKDGTLPVKLFGRELNFRRIKEKGIKWLICYAEDDNLVEKESALAPQRYIDVDTCAFPKGHISIAIALPVTMAECSLNGSYLHGHDTVEGYRDPVHYQMVLDPEFQSCLIEFEQAKRKEKQG